MVVFDKTTKGRVKEMKTLKLIIAILITMGFIFSQQAFGAEKKPAGVLIPQEAQ